MLSRCCRPYGGLRPECLAVHPKFLNWRPRGCHEHRESLEAIERQFGHRFTRPRDLRLGGGEGSVREQRDRGLKQKKTMLSTLPWTVLRGTGA